MFDFEIENSPSYPRYRYFIDQMIIYDWKKQVWMEKSGMGCLVMVMAMIPFTDTFFISYLTVHVIMNGIYLYMQ